MNRLAQVVFDEADTLFDDSFSELSVGLIRKMHVSNPKQRKVS